MTDDTQRPAVAVSSLSKDFGGQRVLTEVSFDVFPGEIVGLLGPNGAGKTTTLRTLVDLIRPDQGAIELGGAPLDRAAMDRLGYLPEERGLYNRSRVLDCVCYFALLKGVPKAVAEPGATQLLTEMGLGAHLRSKCEELSKGMQQKVQFAAAVAHDPQIVLLDEPFSGLDPVSIRQVRARIRGQRAAGKAVLLSTHLMSEAQALCDRVVMLSRGRVVLAGSITDLRRQFAEDRVWRVLCDNDLAACPVAETVVPDGEQRGQRLTLKPGVDPADLFRWLADSGFVVDRLERHLPSLEQIFIRVVRSGDAGEGTSGESDENVGARS